MATQTPPLHPMIQPLNWILGKWRSEDGLATYPTMQPFNYGGEMEFTHIGQPNIHFSCLSWAAESKKPLHRETGFLRVQPDSDKIAWIGAQNVGLSSMEEGVYTDKSIKLESTSVNRLSYAEGTQTKNINRSFELNGDQLVVTVAMETNATPMTHHLKICYRRVK